MAETVGSLNYDYRAKIVRWLDGDTCDTLIDLGFDLSIAQRVRLFGVNAPEVHTKNPAEKEAGQEALRFVNKLCPAGTAVTLRTYKPGDDAGDKFGRFLGRVLLADGRIVNDVLLQVGHVKAWDGAGTKPI